MKNKLTDLNDHLFAQMERLSDEGVKGDKLAVEIERARAVSLVADKIIGNAKLLLDAQKALGDRLIQPVGKAGAMLGIAEK